MNYTEIIEAARARLVEIMDEEWEFPDLAGHIYLSRLLQDEPFVFHRLILDHDLIGMVYTPVIAEAIPYSHVWSPLYLAPENKAIVLKDEELLDGRPAADVNNKDVADEVREKVRKTIIDYVMRRHNFFARFSSDHQEISRKEVPEVMGRVLTVLTDHERILGIGDQGKSGSKIASGKLNCYFLGNGMYPGHALPIGVDVGTNNGAKLADPLYDGVRHKRLKDEEYYPFMAVVLDALASLKPGLVQFEDLEGDRAWEILGRFQKNHSNIFSFNDDSQGTGAVVTAGLLAAERVLPALSKNMRVLFHGAGGSAVGITQQVRNHLSVSGVSDDEISQRIALVDSAGVLYEGRTVKKRRGRGEFYPFQEPYVLKGELRDKLVEAAEKGIDGWSLGDAIPMPFAARTMQANALIGTSTQPGQFSDDLLGDLAETAEEDLLVFSLSNPTSKTECLTVEESEALDLVSPEEREAILKGSIERHLDATKGRMYLATGSPFPAVTWENATYEIGQCNNLFIFPGIGLALDYINAKGLVQDRSSVDMASVMHAASAGAAQAVSQASLDRRSLYPPPQEIRNAINRVSSSILKTVTGKTVSLDEVKSFKWVVSQQPENREYSAHVLEESADFSLDEIREKLRDYRTAMVTR